MKETTNIHGTDDGNLTSVLPDVHVWQPIETAPSPDFKQVFEFLTSIEGAGYGGMAEFEIARETMRRAAERT